MKKRFLKSFFLFALFGGVVAMNLLEFPRVQVRKQLLPPSDSVRYFTFGYKETFGDVFWVRSVQNFSACEQDRGGSTMSGQGKRMGLDRTPACQRGFLFHILSLVLDLVPRFRYASRVGPVILSIVVDDVEGATILFQKAIRNFPDDWIIATRAGYHYVFELEDYQKGAALYYRAAQLGAPSWMALYASKLQDKEGRKDMAIRMIRDFMSSNDLKPEDKKNFEAKLKQLMEE